MGSVNPVFVLPGAMAERPAAIAAGYVQSVTLGTGQFCTNPGILFAVAGEGLSTFLAEVEAIARETAPGTMLHEGIARSFRKGVDRIGGTAGVSPLATGAAPAGGCVVAARLFSTDLASLDAAPHLWDEVFGPASLIVRCADPSQLERVARGLSGHLTASIHGTAEDLAAHGTLVRVLERKVGRLVFNGFPTGIEVCQAMHHGGPYPATTDPHFTSIGGASIDRFVRPVCYQGFPQTALPPELRDRNERGIWRLLDGTRTRDDA
jgi:NADP-dependent aldehyde dehydrogenase